jgi:hypothetical protein
LKESESKVTTPAPTKKTRIMTNEKKGTKQETSGETPTPTANKLGDAIVTLLPDGRLACVIFLKAKYDPNYFSLKISTCGRKVIGKKKVRPSALKANAIYKGLPWADDSQNLHVSTMQSELDRLAKTMVDKDFWEEEVLIQTPFPVIPTFVDEKGEPTDAIDFNGDDDGTQWIFFWLKGAHAKTTTSAPKIRTRNTYYEDDEDDESYTEETVVDEIDSVKAEMDEKFQEVQRQMRQQNEMLQQQLEILLRGMQQEQIF